MSALALGVSEGVRVPEAIPHFGEVETLCGQIAGTRTDSSSPDEPTFIDFERPYPVESFTAVFSFRDRATVRNIPKSGVLCVHGIVGEYRGRPQIVLHSYSNWWVPETEPSPSPLQPTLSNNRVYTNVDGRTVHSPAYSSRGIPAGASAQCHDGSYSFSQHRPGTCSHHGGVAKWF